MRNDLGIDFKALVFGAAIAAAFILFGWKVNDLLYPLSAIGLLYAGYGQKDIKTGALIGAFAAIPIVALAFLGFLGRFSGFFITGTGMLTLTIIILLVGAFVGFVGAWAKRSRVKAKEEYEKKQKIGKKKNKKKNKK